MLFVVATRSLSAVSRKQPSSSPVDNLSDALLEAIANENECLNNNISLDSITCISEDHLLEDDKSCCLPQLKTNFTSASVLNDNKLCTTMNDSIDNDESCTAEEQYLSEDNNSTVHNEELNIQMYNNSESEENQLVMSLTTCTTSDADDTDSLSSSLTHNMEYKSISVNPSPEASTFTELEQPTQSNDTPDLMQEAISVLNDNACKITRE